MIHAYSKQQLIGKRNIDCCKLEGYQFIVLYFSINYEGVIDN